MRAHALLAVVSTALAGCAASGPLPTPTPDGSAVAYTDSLVRQTTAKTLDRFIDTVSDGEEAGYRWLRGWWCPRHPYVGTAADVTRAIGRQCDALGGSYTDRLFCRDRTDSDSVLFVAKVTDTRECSGGPTATIELIEPITDTHDPQYLAKVRSYGFKTAAEQRDAAARRAAEREAAAASDAERRQRDSLQRERERLALLQASLGTRICRYGLFDYVITTGTISAPESAAGQLVGQLDGFADDQSRLRFRVLGFHIPSRSGRAAPLADSPRMGDFVAAPGLVYWDTIDGWAVCE